MPTRKSVSHLPIRSVRFVQVEPRVRVTKQIESAMGKDGLTDCNLTSQVGAFAVAFLCCIFLYLLPTTFSFVKSALVLDFLFVGCYGIRGNKKATALCFKAQYSRMRACI